MKLARFLLNVLLFGVMFIMTLGAQYGVFALLAVQAGPDTERVHFVAKEDTVGYFDAFGYWGADVKTNVTSEPKYYVRNWVDADWWRKGTKWADYAVNFVWGAVRPIFAPVYDIRIMKESNIPEWDPSWRSYTNWKNILVTDEWLLTFLPEEDATALVTPEFIENTDFTYRHVAVVAYYGTLDPTSPVAMSILNNVIDPISKGPAAAAIEGTRILGEGEWVHEYYDVYCFIERVNKYNDPVYAPYKNKFFANGELKVATITVYFQLIMSLVVASYFVSQNRFRLKRTEDGENEVSGGLSLPGFGRRRKKKKKKHDRD